MTKFLLRRVTIFVMILIFTLQVKSQQSFGKYPIQHFTPSMYQAGNQNIDFAQNRDMTLYVANNLGVLSYNGNTWQKHAFRTGKKMRSLAFDEEINKLYVGSQGEFGLFKNNWEYQSLTHLIPEEFSDFDEVWDVFILNKEVYFCTFKGIFIYNGQSISIILNDTGLNRSFQVDGRVFTQNHKGKLFEITDHKLEQSYIQNQTEQIICGILKADEGLLLFYNSGQIELSTSIGSQMKYKELIQALEGSYVNHVLQLSDNRLAISTQSSGLFLYDPQSSTIENITTNEGLASNACLRSFQDYAGNLWLGLQNGISIIDINSPIRLINREIGIQGSGYSAIQVDDGFYYTTSNGIYYTSNDGGMSQFLKGTEGPAYGLQEISGRVYAGHHTGLFLLEDDQAKRIARTDGLWRIEQLKSNPRLAIGGSYSGLYLFDLDKNHVLKFKHKIKGFDESSRFFEEDDEGNIWVGQYYKGLYQLILSSDFKKVSVQEITPGLNNINQEQILLKQVNNDLLIASKTGLYKLNLTNEKIVPSEFFSKSFEGQQVYLLEEDKQKNVHVVAENMVGFFKQISPKNYEFVPSSLHYLRYNLNNDLLNVSTKIKNGVLFSSNEGFIYYDPKLEIQRNLDDPIIVSKVFSAVKDTALYKINPFAPISDDVQIIKVKPYDKVLQINVESFEFNGGYNQVFRYLLDGFDEDYTEWTSISTKEYSNLNEGEYEFTAQTRNHLGEVSTSKALTIYVIPPFHKTMLAKILYGILLLIMLYFLYNYQKRRFKIKAKEIEKISQKELNELELKKEHEYAELQEEKLESELRHVNNLLAASTMNLVVKNEFIESIKGELNEVKLLGKDKRTKKALEGIVKGIDSTLRLQEDWEQFKLHFDKVHGDFLDRLREEYTKLSPNEQKLCALLRLNLNTKEISNLMSISLRGVEVARYRLRKKLELEKGQNLSKFILKY